MAFHSVVKLVVGGKETKVYLQKETSTFLPDEVEKIEKCVVEVFEENASILDHGKKNVLIVWGDNGESMIDWWIWGEDESVEEGATIEVFLFRGKNRYESPLVTAEDGLKVLASEISR